MSGDGRVGGAPVGRPARGGAPRVRFPIEPLADAAGITLGQIGGHQPDDHPSGIARLAELIGVKPRWARHLRHQGITEEQADKAATALGLHPITIWPAEWPQALLHGQLQGSARVNAQKDHCPRGHAYTHTDASGFRRCRWCQAENMRKLRKTSKNVQRVALVTQPELWEASWPTPTPQTTRSSPP